MMNIRYYIVPLMLAVVSCTDRHVDMDSGKWEDVCFSVDGMSVLSTRTISSAAEETASDIQIAVYSPSGLLCASGETSGGTVTLSVPVDIGGYSVAALVNSKQSLASCASMESAAELPSSLTENAASKSGVLAMYGTSLNQTFHTGKTCTVPVTRVPAKVEIDKIVNNIPSNPDFTVKAIYLINVNTSSDVSGKVTTAVWSQKRKYDATEEDVALYTYDLVNQKITKGQSIDTPHYFYCYANPTQTDTSAPEWSPRYTRLVVEAVYQGKTTYYPINIVGTDNMLNPGTGYVITQLTITGPGSDDPDVPVSKLDASFKILVNDWGKGFSQGINY